MSNVQRFCLEQEMLRLGAKRLGCMVSVFSDTSSVHVGLFLPLADHFLPVHIIVDHHTGTC